MALENNMKLQDHEKDVNVPSYRNKFRFRAFPKIIIGQRQEICPEVAALKSVSW